MLVCTRCGVLVGALFRSGGRLFATVNARAVEGTDSFASDQPVSPKRLSADDKVSRWTSLRFADVTVEEAPP
jgi:hypothetical protein